MKGKLLAQRGSPDYKGYPHKKTTYNTVHPADSLTPPGTTAVFLRAITLLRTYKSNLGNCFMVNKATLIAIIGKLSRLEDSCRHRRGSHVASETLAIPPPVIRFAFGTVLARS